jgi:hypothetical protein
MKITPHDDDWFYANAFASPQRPEIIMTPTPIKVVSQEEGEQADYLICCRVGVPSAFKDNEIGTCGHCGHEVFFRPHTPRKPMRICMECAVAHIKRTPS